VQVPFTSIVLCVAVSVYSPSFLLHDGIRVIITSGMVRIARSGLSGNTIFFEKPYDLDKVVSSIRQLAAA
jgi:hypothetical protein